MSLISDMVRNLAAIALLAGFLEIMLPSSSLRPFVRFAIGLFVVIAVLNPTLKFVNQTQDLAMEAWEVKYPEKQTEMAVHQGEALRNKMLKEASNQLKAKTKGQVAAIASLVPGVESLRAEVKLDDQGKISHLVLIVGSKPKQDKSETFQVDAFIAGGREREEKKDIEQKLIDLVKNLYGLEPEQVKVEFEGG